MEEEMRNNITKFQLFFILVLTQVGVGVLSLPHMVQESAKGDGWISTLLAGLVVQAMLFIYWQLLKRFPSSTYTEITQKVVGNSLGKLLNMIIYLYFILVGGLSTILFIQVINLWLLPLTPRWIISLLILSSCIYLTVSNIKIIARFCVLAFSLIILLFLMSLLSWTSPKELLYVLPIGDSGMKNILMGSKSSIFAVLGFEGLLFLYAFVMDNKKGVWKVVSMSNLFITLFYTYFMFITIISFTTDQLSQMRQPVLNLLRFMSFEMVDRVDLIFLSIWIVPMATTIISYIYFASKSLNVKEKHYKVAIAANGVLLFIISLFPMNDIYINTFNYYVQIMSYVVVFFIPTLLLILSLLLKKQEKSELA